MKQTFKVSFKMIAKCKHPSAEMEIPAKSSVVGIGEKTFIKHGKDIVEKIIIPDNIRIIKEGAFSGMTKLHTVVFPENGCVILEENAFANCVSLKTVENMHSVVCLEKNSFKGCINLQSIDICQNIKKISEDVFCGCKSLSEIVVPDGVSAIPGKAFCDCDTVKDLIVNDSVKSIGKQAFLGCVSLENISLGNKLETIDESAFESCYNIKSIEFGSKIKNIKKKSFANCRLLETVMFKTEEIPTDKKLKIAAKAFCGCFELRRIILPNRKVSISPKAFEDCRLGEESKLIIVATDSLKADDVRKALASLIKSGQVEVITPDMDTYVEKDINESEKELENVLEETKEATDCILGD